MDTLLSHYLVLWRPLGYFFVFLGMVFEGDIFLFTAAFLTHQGFFDFGDILITILSGVALGDLLWYWLGVRFGHQDSFIGRLVFRIAGPLDDYLKNRLGRTILTSKFAYGLHHPILARAGALRINLPQFIKKDVLANALWIIVIGGLGYFSSFSFRLIKKYLRYTEFALLTALAALILAEYFFRRHSRW